MSKNDLSADEKNAAWMKLLQMMKSVKLQKETVYRYYIRQYADEIVAAIQKNNAQEKDTVRMAAIG